MAKNNCFFYSTGTSFENLNNSVFSLEFLINVIEIDDKFCANEYKKSKNVQNSAMLSGKMKKFNF